MKDSEVLKRHRNCLVNNLDCEDMDCYECDYLTDEDELIEALDKAIEVLGTGIN